MDRHGPIHLGEGQAVALIGDDLGGVRWRTSDKAALAAKLAQIQQFARSALYVRFPPAKSSAPHENRVRPGSETRPSPPERMRHVLLDAHAANWPGFAPLRWRVFGPPLTVVLGQRKKRPAAYCQ
jgi:hypothetical protein